MHYKGTYTIDRRIESVVTSPKQTQEKLLTAACVAF